MLYFVKQGVCSLCVYVWMDDWMKVYTFTVKYVCMMYVCTVCISLFMYVHVRIYVFMLY